MVLNHKKHIFCLFTKCRIVLHSDATAAAECMAILRFVNVQKRDFFKDLEPLDRLI